MVRHLLVTAVLLLATTTASAEPPLPVEPSPQPTSPKPALHKKKKQPTYKEWLETYKAWDKLDQVYSGKDQSQEDILHQATNAMQAGNPRRVLEILESTPPFEDNNSTEADRLWLGAQAYRALGSPEIAVLWHLEAAELMSPGLRKRKMSGEPGLGFIWKDVFRKLYQQYAANITLSREAQGEYLERMIRHANTAWPTDIFWSSVQKVYSNTAPPQDSQEAVDSRSVWVNSFDSSKIALAQLIANCILGIEDAKEESISNSDQPYFNLWTSLISLIETGDQSADVALSDELHSSRAARFIESGMISEANLLSESWNIPIKSAEFEAFNKNTRRLSPYEIHALFVDGKAESLMIGDIPDEELLPYRLALAIHANDRSVVTDVWEEIDTNTLPNSLKLASIVYLGLDFKDVFDRSPDVSQEADAHWMTLLEAAGRVPPLPYKVHFWEPVLPAKNRKNLIRNWPLDLDVMLAVWKYDWNKNPKRSLARRLLYLYPEDQFGMLCGLYLAEESLKDKQLALSEYYLSGVDPAATNSTLTAEYHRVNAEMLIYKEDMDGAYQAYQQLVETGAPIDDTTRLKIAFLLQQRGELQAGREHLTRLWERKDEFDTAMQAEILFYLAEGDQAMGQSEQALDSYLQLAWKYPQESMWALTAMYRAATIYESREQYEPAARLLKTVVKNAQTGKQREAAKAKLEHIQARRAKETGHGVGKVPYPF